jgi:hypothetical protein
VQQRPLYSAFDSWPLYGQHANRFFTVAFMPDADFTCRYCFSKNYFIVGRSRLGTTMYACSGCTIVFLDPKKFCNPVKTGSLPYYSQNLKKSGSP